jgi:polyhydroxyalkanoate synthase subunit PhaC
MRGCHREPSSDIQLRAILEEWQWTMDRLFHVASESPFLARRAGDALNVWLDAMSLGRTARLPCPSSVLDAQRRFLRVGLGALAPPTGTTPHDALPLAGGACLRRYGRGKSTGSRPPLLLVNSLINRHYILDLHARRSFIQFLLKEGFDVFALDWGEPDDDDAQRDFAHYADFLLGRAISLVIETSRSNSVDMLGYSMGGVLALTHATLAPDSIRRLALIGAPSDFVHATPISEWVRADWFDPDKLAHVFGNIPAWLASASFRALKPFTHSSKGLRLWLGLNDAEDLATQLAVEIWLTDGVALPGRFYADFIKVFYQQNALWRDALNVNGAPARLANITSPILNVFGSRDQIVPSQSCSPLGERLGVKRVTQKSFPVGHLALLVGERAPLQTWRVISDWFRST